MNMEYLPEYRVQILRVRQWAKDRERKRVKVDESDVLHYIRKCYPHFDDVTVHKIRNRAFHTITFHPLV